MLSRPRLQRLRSELLQERMQLSQQIANLAASTDGVTVSFGNHMAEDATAAFDQATSVSLRRGHELTLKQVEEALARIEDGSYGRCERCGDEIDFARLKAIPHAMLCMSCQKLIEL